jgi:adenylate cyclase
MAQTISEVVGRLESGNRELRRAYDQARQANEENGRLQEIVRRYVAGSAWAEAERSIREGVQIQSQVRAVTVLFTDIVNFTPFSESHTPREVVRALNGYFWWVSRTIAEHGGEINKYTGDGVLAVFASAEAALEAGRVLLDKLAEWNAQRTALGQPELHTRIGINSGRAMIGTIGGPDRQDRTVLGDVVNTAARLQTAARPDTVLISEATFVEAGRPIEYTTQQSVLVKGKADPLTVYEYPAKSREITVGPISQEALDPTS